MSGPRVQGLAGDDALLTWADPTSGDYRVWVANSGDAGQSWGGDHVVADAGDAQRLPSITRASDGRVWLSYGVSLDAGRLTSSTDDGANFTDPITLGTSDGNLDALELCAGGTRAGAVGVTPSGSLWWVALPVQ